MSTKTMKEKAAELLQKCEVVTLASVNKEGYPRPVPMSKIAAEEISTIWMSTGDKLFPSFYTSLKRRVCVGHCGGVALGEQSFGFVHFLYHYVDGNSLFCQSDIFCAGA